MGSLFQLSKWLRALATAVLVLLVAPVAQAVEVIREQDAAGQVRIVREVAEDAAGNCVNHGLWQLRGADGRLAAEGHYEMGLRAGAWQRWLSAADIPKETAAELMGFELPLTSRAEYAAGAMHGLWTITDARGRKCFSIQLERGERHGELRGWSLAGEVVRRESYIHGRLDGASMTWNNATNSLEHTATWVNGFRLVRSVAYYPAPSTDHRSEGDYLLGPQTVDSADDFWTTQIANHRYGQECIPHGLWTHWHVGGQVAAEGRYSWGRPAGEFVWRHANGQKAAEGSYTSDGRPTGVWRWWNSDGAHLAAVALNQETPPPGAAILKAARQPAANGSAARR